MLCTYYIIVQEIQLKYTLKRHHCLRSRGSDFFKLLILSVLSAQFGDKHKSALGQALCVEDMNITVVSHKLASGFPFIAQRHPIIYM